MLLIVVLNFNGLDDTLACLLSLRGQSCRDFDVLVIDNGSSADDAAQIAARCREVEMVALPENLGWAGGNNVGLQCALDRGYRYVCLLNNDTVLDPTAIEELLAASTALGEPCMLHPAIAYFDDPTQWQLNPRLHSSEHATSHDKHSELEMFAMDFAYGACLMVSADVLRRVGLLDERFFLQLEEADYFQRAKALGIRSFCALRARILHKESISFGGRVTDSKTYYQVRNQLLLAEKHSPTPAGFLRAIRALIWTLHRQAQDCGAEISGWTGFTGWILSAHPLARAARQGAGDYLRRRFGRRPAPLATKTAS